MALSAESIDKILSFRNRIIDHPTLMDARQRLEQIIAVPGSVRILLLIGPSGVGKSTMLDVVVKDLIRRAKTAMQQDAGHIFASVASLQLDLFSKQRTRH